jgi:hypothetical protein
VRSYEDKIPLHRLRGIILIQNKMKHQRSESKHTIISIYKIKKKLSYGVVRAMKFRASEHELQQRPVKIRNVL